MGQPNSTNSPGAGGSTSSPHQTTPTAPVDEKKRVQDKIGNSSAGGQRLTNRLLNEAQQTFTGPTGNVFNAAPSAETIIGTVNLNGPSGTGVTRYRIAAERAALARHAFVEDDGYQALRTACAGRSLVLVQAPRGQGRAAAALRVLHDRGHAEFFGFVDRVPFDRIQDAIGEGAGHLVESAPDDHVRQLSALILSDLERKLASVGATLVVTISDSASFIDPDLARFVVPLSAPTAHLAIVESHLRYRLDRVIADAVLAQDDFRTLFDEMVKPDADRTRAAEFAWHAAQLGERGEVDLAILRARMSGSIAADVKSWFSAIPGQPLKCLAIAVALLDGLPYQTVESAAVALTRSVEPPPPPDHINPPPPPDKFGQTRHDRLGAVRAQTMWSTRPSPFGDLPDEIVQFIDRGYPRAVLDLVWREYPAIRGDLLGWLTEMADHPDEAVQVRAATAVGTIAITAFEFIYQEVLYAWATSRNDYERAMAAYALSVPGQDPRMQDQIRAVVDEWTKDPDTWQLRATAARVFGAALGATDYVRTFQKLHQIAATETLLSPVVDEDGPDGDIALAVSVSISELVDAEPRLALHAVEQALRWMRDGKGRRTVAGELTFLFLAANLVTAHGDGGAMWPTLLSLSARSQELRTTVAACWQHCLEGLFNDLARIVASSWAIRVEAIPAARDAYAQVLTIAAAGHERTANIIKVSLVRAWRHRAGDTYAPETARAVDSALS